MTFLCVLIACFVLTAFCITIGWLCAGMPNLLEPPRRDFQPHDPDYYRARWKAAGYALHLPSYRNGTEKYTLAKDANTIVPQSWLRGLYESPPVKETDY